MVTYLQPGDAAHTFDLDNLYNSLRGNAVTSGGAPTKGDNAMETDVSGGSGYILRNYVEFNGQPVIHDAGGANPRFDVVYLDSGGTLQIQKGAEAVAEHPNDDTETFSNNPYEFVSPAPPDFTDFSGTPVALVAIPAGAADYTEADHLRDVRLDPVVYSDTVEARANTLLPAYDEISSAPQTDRSVIWVSGDGSDPQGVYQYNGSTYIEVGAGLSLSDINIGSDWDVDDYAIENVNSIQVNDAVRVHNGRGTFNFAAHHGKYGTGTSTEIFRFDLEAGEQLEVWRLDVAPQGGGATDTDFSVSIEDDGGNVLATATELTTGDTSPIGVSADGQSVAGYVTNNTGGEYIATISGQVSIVGSN